MQPKKVIDIDKVMRLFELSWDEVPDIRVPERSYDEMHKKLVHFRLKFKKAYRKIVMKYHPDHGGDLEKMQEINEIYDIIMNQIKIQVPQPRPTFTVRVYGNNWGYDSWTSTSTTTGW